MNCSNCGFRVEKGWRHCPQCGIGLGPGRYGAGGDLFSQVFRELEEMTKNMGIRADKDMEVIDISGMLEDMMKSMGKAGKSPNRRGFSLRIHQKNDEQPKVVFRRIGGDRKLHSTGKAIFPKLRKPVEGKQPTHKLGIKLPHETSEPETEIRRVGNKVLVEISLPNVRSSGDIDISELENSIEVKAVAGSGSAADAAGRKGYFKIIRKPEFSRIAKKSFSDGVLRLELL